VENGNAPAPDTPAASDPDLSQVEFAMLYYAEQHKLMLYLIRTWSDVSFHDVADAAQDAFAELWAKWATVDNPRAWLRTVAHRKLYARLGKQEEIPLSSLRQEPAGLDAALELELSEQSQAVLAAIHQLSPRLRQVFALHYDNFSTAEIAEILQITHDAARQNLCRARTSLKKILELPRVNELSPDN
jgi:RNA polymerase sigma factor (sigma-70 family)